MQQLTKDTFGPVTRFEISTSIIGNPIMSTSCYLINRTLIDTGQAHARKTVHRLVQQLNIDQVVLTHYHEDHSGNAATIKKIKQIPIYGHPLTAHKLKKGFGIRPYQYLMWGKSKPAELLPIPRNIECGNIALEAIHTPGHSFDHLSFYVAKEGWLFSGDLFLSSRIRYFRSDEDIADTISSLKKVLLLDFDSLFCAHNPKPVRGKLALKAKLDFMENLYGEIDNMVSKGLDHSRIIKHFKKSEAQGIKMLTFGDVSYENLIRSILKNF
jgi:glyoxylase-like metal-dependent hydrolase (beta-lactamase superfamily II)